MCHKLVYFQTAGISYMLMLQICKIRELPCSSLARKLPTLLIDLFSPLGIHVPLKSKLCSLKNVYAPMLLMNPR